MNNVIIHDDLWMCADCTIWLCNADATGMSDERAADVQAGEQRLTANGDFLSANFDSETGEGCDVEMRTECACCDCESSGKFNRFALFRSMP